jgi:hypothetical protein
MNLSPSMTKMACTDIYSTENITENRKIKQNRRQEYGRKKFFLGSVAVVATSHPPQ